MDSIDKELLRLLGDDARMTVKDLAARVNLTSPAVSERIHRMERNGDIRGYTVIPGNTVAASNINALISVSLPGADRARLLAVMEQQPAVRQCFQVTGSLSFILNVSCRDVPALEDLINLIQDFGQTSTQIILSTMIDRTGTPLPE